MPQLAATESIRTGVLQIDQQLMGGIRHGSLVLIEGPPASGKSVITQHLVYYTLTHARGLVSYYTTEHDVRGIIHKMEELSMSCLHFLLADAFRIYPVRLPISPREALKSLYRLEHHVQSLPERFNFIVIDSIDLFIRKLNAAHKMEFFRKCKDLCGENRIVILTATPYVFDKQSFSRANILCDYHLALDMKMLRFHPENPEDRVIRELRVCKLHGSDFDTNSLTLFEIKPESGIQPIPYASLRI